MFLFSIEASDLAPESTTNACMVQFQKKSPSRLTCETWARGRDCLSIHTTCVHVLLNDDDAVETTTTPTTASVMYKWRNAPKSERILCDVWSCVRIRLVGWLRRKSACVCASRSRSLAVPPRWLFNVFINITLRQTVLGSRASTASSVAQRVLVLLVRARTDSMSWTNAYLILSRYQLVPRRRVNVRRHFTNIRACSPNISFHFTDSHIHRTIHTECTRTQTINKNLWAHTSSK